MIILSNQGYWKKKLEKNQLVAFNRSFDMGFGTKLDLRDSKGKIVISNDMPKGNEMSFDDLLKIMKSRNLPLAINIKADGLGSALKEILEKYNHTNYFTFDMSIPDMIMQIKDELQVFTSISDIMKTPVFFNRTQGICLDCVNSDWYDESLIDNLIEQSKKVCILSADLHKRNTQKQWDIIKNCKNIESNNLMLCTDYPEKAKDYF